MQKRFLVVAQVLLVLVCSARLGAQSRPAYLTTADVFKMINAGVSPDTIVLVIREAKTDFALMGPNVADDEQTLRRNGVDERVISAFAASSQSPRSLIS
jgi:hypothetical protein